MKNWIKGLTNVLMGYAVIIAGITLYQRIESYRLGGACPVPLQKPWLYTGIAAAVLAFLLMFVKDKRKGSEQ
ncbi:MULTISPECIES: hypothetical protein [unclassified Fusibacter]|uniref:hypothetical protein n=1 Tax=unclassified Fusibacter TaxID=2624464 RepID=UPI00101187B9|nr:MULTISPECIES: hypothetical protein [unclassified Fusibacter]MCK8059395.1 hypothetical protein [Fusibacter sp. A2]NPE21141.1 hypothetical protein [Fusibacter sp. A1]RXV62410.1 hypothetical protein DWB64_04845 [Fusibacter sp. A1]